jgi:hypothetical protein
VLVDMVGGDLDLDPVWRGSDVQPVEDLLDLVGALGGLPR